MKWERLDRRTVYAGWVVDVHVDRVRIETGGDVRESEYDVVHHPGAASIVALYEDGTVALLTQFRYPVGGWIREIPAGSLEDGESYETCAERELAEEVGVRAGRWTPLATYHTTPGFCDEEMRVFLAEDLTPADRALDADEHLTVERVPLADAVSEAEGGGIPDAKTIVGLCAARARLVDEGRWPPAGA